MMRFVTGILVLALIVAVSGCGDQRPKRVPVAGKVLIDGQPLTYGFIQVIPENDRAATAKIGPDGSFRLTTFEENDGCVPGHHKVAVIANESLNPLTQKWHAPQKYMETGTSGLTIDVSDPTDSLVIELSWQGGKPFIEKFEAE